ncbi:MAG: OmpH family outer membrane protein [Clostridia bacterium]|nr:OmpH family outer membrane protein [Deltaproteobacteria bacterium]
MKYPKFLAVTLLAISFVSLSFAGVAHAEEKVGYVDMARAFNELEDSKQAKDQLKRDFDGKQKTLDEAQNKLKAKKDEFDAKSAMMKVEVKQQKQEELQKDFATLQQTYMQLQQDLSKREGALVQDITRKLRKIVEKVGDRDNYGMILDIGETVLYYKRHQDITDTVIREYNKEYGTSTAKEASAAAAKK